MSRYFKFSNIEAAIKGSSEEVSDFGRNLFPGVNTKSLIILERVLGGLKDVSLDETKTIVSIGNHTRIWISRTFDYTDFGTSAGYNEVYGVIETISREWDHDNGEDIEYTNNECMEPLSVADFIAKIVAISLESEF